MIEISEYEMIKEMRFALWGNDCLEMEDQQYYREQLYAQMMGWA